MKCPNCGNVSDSNAKFCCVCGTKLEERKKLNVADQYTEERQRGYEKENMEICRMSGCGRNRFGSGSGYRSAAKRTDSGNTAASAADLSNAEQIACETENLRYLGGKFMLIDRVSVQSRIQ